MKNRLTKNLLTDAILFIFFIFVFIQACGPAPATAITDTTQTPIGSGSGSISGLSSDPIIGEITLTITSMTPTAATITFNGGLANGGSATLTNISGDGGHYTYGNNEMTLSVSVADANSVTVNLTRLKAPYLLLENVTCFTP